MIEVDVYNDKKRLLGSMFGGDVELPDGVSEIKITSSQRGSGPGFRNLLSLLKLSNATIKTVTMESIQMVSPDCLAFLVWISSRTHTLDLKDCILGDNGFACLMSCILVPSGLKKLTLILGEGSPEITRHQATLLFEGVASSSSLETLWIQAKFGDLDQMGHGFVQMLRQNRSLKDVDLRTSPFTDASIIPNMLKAAALQTKVKELYLGQSSEIVVAVIPMDLFADIVCRKDCSLRAICFDSILPDLEDNTDDTATERNSSVEKLLVTSAGIVCSEAMKIIRLFDCLNHLDLDDNEITDLSPLDPLLMRGDKSAIEVLALNGNDICETHFNIFLKKLPRMTSLKSLEIARNPALTRGVLSEPCLNALKDAVWLNKSLEQVYYQDDATPKLLHVDSMIRYATSLNRGAKRKLLDEYPLSLPQNLWAHVLKRATTIKYYDFDDELDAPTLTSPRSDVVFWLLRQKMLC